MSTVTLLDLLALGNGALFLPFFTTKDAEVLKLICRLFASIIKVHLWHDTTTRVYNVALWRHCFPNATACLVVLDIRKGKTSGDLRPLKNIKWIKFVSRGMIDDPSNLNDLFALSECIHVADAYWSVDPYKLRRVRELTTIRCRLTDGHLAHLCAVRKLHVGGDLMGVTDRGVQCLKSVRSLELWESYFHMPRPDGPPVDPPVLTDAAIEGLPIEHLRLEGLNCQFSPAGFAQLPLRYLTLADLSIEIPVGQLKALVNLSFLQIRQCPFVKLGDEDIACMLKLTQLVVYECPVHITGHGLLQLVTAQIKEFERSGNFLERLDDKPKKYEFFDRTEDWRRPRWDPPPYSLYNPKEWKRIRAMRKKRNARNQPCLYQVGIELLRTRGMECTFEDRNELLLYVPYLGIPPWVFDPDWSYKYIDGCDKWPSSGYSDDDYGDDAEDGGDDAYVGGDGDGDADEDGGDDAYVGGDADEDGGGDAYVGGDDAYVGGDDAYVGGDDKAYDGGDEAYDDGAEDGDDYFDWPPPGYSSDGGGAVNSAAEDGAAP